jgi:acetyl esterase
MGARVSVTSVRYLGMIHDFLILNVLADTPAAEEAITQGAGILNKVIYS